MPKRSTNQSKKRKRGYQLKLSRLEASARTKKGWIKRHGHTNYMVNFIQEGGEEGAGEEKARKEQEIHEKHGTDAIKGPEELEAEQKENEDFISTSLQFDRPGGPVRVETPRDIQERRNAQARAYNRRLTVAETAKPQVKAALRQHYVHELGWEEATLAPHSKANPTDKPVPYFFNPAKPDQVTVPDYVKLEQTWIKTEPDRETLKQHVKEMGAGEFMGSGNKIPPVKEGHRTIKKKDEPIDLHGLTIEKNQAGTYNIYYPGKLGESKHDKKNLTKEQVNRAIDNYTGVEVFEPTLKFQYFKEREDGPQKVLTKEERAKLIRQRRSGLASEDIDLPHFDTPEELYERSGHERVQGLKKGWEAQHEFNKEQQRRRRNQYTSGGYYRGWSLYGPGSPKRAPQEKSDIGVGANKQYRIETNRWELINPKEAEESRSKIRFRIPQADVMKKDTRETKLGWETDPDTGEQRQGLKLLGSDAPEGVKRYDVVRGILNDAGVQGADITREPHHDEEGNVTSWDYSVVTSKGNLINPGQAAQIYDNINKEFDVKTPYVPPEGPAFERVIVRSPAAASKLPKGIQEDEVFKSEQVKNIYGKGVHTTLGHREYTAKDIEEGKRGKLAEGQRDVVTATLPRLPGQKEPGVAYWNLQERTDAVGFGKSYRPGEKEISEFLTVPARYKEKRRAEEATNQYMGDYYYDRHGNPIPKGDPSELDALVREKYPDASPDKIKKIRDEIAVATAAAPAAVYYSAKKDVGGRLLQRIPLVRKYSIVGDETREAYREYAGQKYARAVDRVKHPLTDPLDPDAQGWDVVLKPETYKPIRYRKHFITPAKRAARGIERERRQLQELGGARAKIRKAYTDNPEDLPRAARINRKVTLRTAGGVMKRSDEIGYDTKVPYMAEDEEAAWKTAAKRDKNWKEDPVAVEHQKSFQALKELNERSDTSIDKDLLKEAQKPSRDFIAGEARLPKVGKAGLYIGGAAAVAGGGVYLYDRHKQHEISEGNTQGLSRHLPEKVAMYQPRVRVTKKYQFPDNNFTSALDIENKKMPYAWRVEAHKKNIQLRNHKDVSGEPYHAAPLIGSVKLEKAEGSVGKSLMYEPTSGLKTQDQTRLYVGGKEVPGHVTLGKKERWDQRGPKTKRLSKANPNKLTSKEREQIAFLYTSSSDPHDKVMIENLYGGDEKIQELLEDPEEMTRIRRQQNNLYAGGRSGEVLSTRKFYMSGPLQDQLEQAYKSGAENRRRAQGAFDTGLGGVTVEGNRDIQENRRRATQDYKAAERRGSPHFQPYRPDAE